MEHRSRLNAPGRQGNNDRPDVCACRAWASLWSSVTIRKQRFPTISLFLALTVRLCPAARRVQLAERLTALLMRFMRPKVTHSLREATLYRVLDLLTRNGTTFPLPLVVRGADGLTSAIGFGTGVLVIGTHSVLNTLTLRYLHDLGYVPDVLAVEPEFRVIGTRSVLTTMCPSAATLLRIRRRLAEGHIVCAMVDGRPPNERRTTEFVTASGDVRVSDTLFRLASRCGAKVLFTYVHLESDGRIVNVLDAPDHVTESAGAIGDRFKRFVQDQAAWAATLP